jgi:hypothetical protein
MKIITAILLFIRDIVFSAGFPPYRYLALSGVKYDRTYRLCKAVKKTTGRDTSGRYVIIGPFGECFSFSRSVSGRVCANNYDVKLAARLMKRKTS